MVVTFFNQYNSKILFLFLFGFYLSIFLYLYLFSLLSSTQGLLLFSVLFLPQSVEMAFFWFTKPLSPPLSLLLCNKAYRFSHFCLNFQRKLIECKGGGERSGGERSGGEGSRGGNLSLLCYVIEFLLFSYVSFFALYGVIREGGAKLSYQR